MKDEDRYKSLEDKIGPWAVGVAILEICILIVIVIDWLARACRDKL